MSCLNNTILTKEIRPHAAPWNFSFNSIMMIKCEDYQLMQKCDEDMYNIAYPKKCHNYFCDDIINPNDIASRKEEMIW